MFKLKFLLSTLACFMLVLNSHAKIWRVNNNPSVTADFTSLSTAILSSTVLSGDTIHLEPSPDSYGSATIAKKVIIIGNGYFLDENLNLQATPTSSKADAITFNNGAQGSVLLGIDFRASTVTIYCNDIVVEDANSQPPVDPFLIGLVGLFPFNISRTLTQTPPIILSFQKIMDW